MRPISLKKLFTVLISAVIILPAVSYCLITVANNRIADKIEAELIEYPLPENTALVDSVSVAGKLVGSGNGMQYMGAILIESRLTEEELRDYYCSDLDHVEVRKQKTAKIDFINSGDYSFSGFFDDDGKTYYSISCWDAKRSETYGDFIACLLDLDIRAH